MNSTSSDQLDRLAECSAALKMLHTRMAVVRGPEFESRTHRVSVIPEATEPPHIGSTFSAAAPERDTSSPWSVDDLVGAIALVIAVAGAVFGVWS